MDFNFHEFLIKAKKANASDIHFRVGKAPSIRVDGKILKMSMPSLNENDFENILAKVARKNLLEKIRNSNNDDIKRISKNMNWDEDKISLRTLE